MSVAPGFSIDEEGSPDGVRTVVIAGELDAAADAALRGQIDAVAGAGDLIIDLSRLTFLDSASLGALLDVARVLRKAGKRLAVVVGDATQPRARFDLTGTRSLLNVCHDRDEALAVLAAPAAPPRAAAPDAEPVRLTLYHSSRSAHAGRARRAADQLREHLEPDCVVNVVDIAEDPSMAERMRILALPLLVREGPGAVRRVAGDLGDLDGVVLALDLPVPKGSG